MKRKLLIKNNNKQILPAIPLKTVCLAGLALTLIVSLVIVFFSSKRSGDPGLSASAVNRNFTRELRTYDLYDGPKRALAGENPAQIEKQISRLQKQARGAEEHLSVLKRRRALALIDRQFISSYKKAAREAAENFGYSAPLAAVASDAIVLGGVPLSAEDRDLLKKYASRVSQNRFDTMELGVHVLAGNMDSASKAAGTAAVERLLSRELPAPALSAQRRQELQIDEFLLKAVRGDIPGATIRINALLGEAGRDESLIRMGAEFFYDHHNPFRAGELFSRLSGEQDIARAADSLVLAGEIKGARNIWLTLASGITAGENSRSLYNLAVSSPNQEEELFWLEKLLAGGLQPAGLRNDSADNHRIYSIIRYTQLKETAQSIAILEGLAQNHHLLDLELLRRRLETLPPTRSTAEVWMLINRNSGEEDIYEWAAWYFDHQRLFNETARLIKEAGRKGMASPWIKLHQGLAFLRDGKINEGEKILKEASAFRDAGTTDWRFPANLGRVQEGRRAISLALDYYEEAERIISWQRSRNKTAAALLQIRKSRCLETLGRPREAIRALEYAVELDPDNLIIRRELAREQRRIEGRQ